MRWGWNFICTENSICYDRIAIISILDSLYLFEIYSTFSSINNCTHYFHKPRIFFYSPPKTRDDKYLRSISFLTVPLYSHIFKKFRDFDANSDAYKSRNFYSGKNEKFDDVYKKVISRKSGFKDAYGEGKNLLFQLSGAANSKTFLCQRGADNPIFYMSDDHGFNNTEGLCGGREINVALVGDSFVHGVRVNAEKHMSSIIKEEHPNLLNLGYSGSGLLTQLGVIKEYVSVIKPGIVLWCFLKETIRKICKLN